ncbi:MAG: hypothetical protein PHQ27_09395 [Victivallales bacterium]|nr:hypothetical protein [Victivallales bacterium]
MVNSRILCTLLVAAGLTAGNFLHAQGKEKKLLFKQDDAQETFVSKVYELKHLNAGDITPFILGAVKRYNTNSQVERLNYKFGKKQLLLVSTPPKMMKYVDDMLAKLDRPVKKKDHSGSVIEGTGIYRFAYLPKYRSTNDMLTILNKAVISGDGDAFRDSASNLLYWKDSYSDGMDVMQWAKQLDRPVPQVELEFKVYEVRKSLLDDVGVDYLAWKNGPGLNLFQVGYDNLVMQATESALANMDKFSSWSYGGFFAAPQFDLSFVRMLSQKGLANIAGTGHLTIVNNYSHTYSVKFSPEHQNIRKDSSDKSSVNTGASAAFQIDVIKPVICFKITGEKDRVSNYNGDNFDLVTYQNIDGTIIFAYSVAVSDVVERNNRGTELTGKGNIKSDLTLDLGEERLLAVYDKTQKVEQTIGIPFLCEIPYLKYLFGSTTTIDEDVKMIVSVKARLVHPEDRYSAWSGRLLTREDIVK